MDADSDEGAIDVEDAPRPIDVETSLDAPLVADEGALATDVADASVVDAYTPAACDERIAPRPIAPRTGAHTTGRRPSFAWRRPASVETVRVVLCRDRALTTDCVWQDATGDGLTWSTDLVPGLWHWGLRGLAGGEVRVDACAVRRLYVGSRAGVAHAWGGDYDANGDGFADDLTFHTGTGFGAPLGTVWFGSPAGLTAGAATIGELAPALPMWHWTHPVGVGDVDGDGYDDAALIKIVRDSAVLLLLRGSAGGPLPAREIPLPAYGLTIGRTEGFVFGGVDLNGDGFDDVIVAGYLTPLLWMRGGPGGPVVAGVINADSRDANRCISLGDIDGDGDGEIVCFDGASSEVTLYLGSPAGPDIEHRIPLPEARGSFPTPAGDVDGDGLADYIHPYAREPLRLGDGRALSLPSTPDRWWPGTFADTNGDGFTDGVLTGEAPGWARGGPAGFSPATTSVAAGCGFDDWMFISPAGDTNGDGREDIVAGAFGDVRIEFGGSAGLESGALVWDVPSEGAASARPLGDVNGDGRIDLGIVDATGATVIYGGASALRRGEHLTFGPSSGSALVQMMAPGDVDGDHRADVLLARPAQPWRLYRSSGGALDRAGVAVAGTASEDLTRAFAGGDLNGDGCADLGLFRVSEVQMWPGGPTGLTGATSTLRLPLRSGDRANFAAPLGDVTGDGIPDAFAHVGHDIGGLTLYSALLLRGTSTGWVFSGRDFGGAYTASDSILHPLGDVTGDHRRDVLACSQDTCGVYACGPSVGTIATFWASGGYPRAQSLGDLDGDGLDEVLTRFILRSVDRGTRWQVSGRCPSMPITPLGDVNGDGHDDLLLGDRVQLGGLRAPGLAPTVIIANVYPPS